MNLYKGIVLAACAVFLAAWLSLPRAAAQGEAGPFESDAARRERAREVFEQRCARCHGRDGRGSTRLGKMLGAPDFTDAEWWRAVSDERARASITDGRGEMPAFGNKLTRPEVKSLAAYARAFAAGRR